ncbi:DC-STAMP domain-containing protein [Aphelenchoides besseyi]|nr:DC-STAMP domain-containing protein [Aphelenchoides besseyi]
MSLRELIGLKLKALFSSISLDVYHIEKHGKSGQVGRVLLGAVFLHTVGVIFYATTSLKYAIVPRNVGVFVGLAVQLMLVGVLILPLLRAITLLSIPSLLTGRLRAALMLLVPASNIVTNIRNTAEGVACVHERVRQSAQETREAAGSNLKTITQERFNEFAQVAYGPFLEMRETLRNVDDSVNRMIAWQRNMYKTVRDLFDSCEKFMRLPFNRCTTLVDSMYYDCTDATFDAFCLPIRLLHLICHSTRVLQLHCEWPGAMKKQLEESVGPYTKDALRRSLEMARDTAAYKFYATAKDKVNMTIDSARSVSMSINYTHTADTDFNVNVNEIKRRLHDEIAAFEWFANAIARVLDLLMWLVLISPILSAIVYVSRFHLGESVDNYFLDSNFEQIDERRQANGQFALLPLLPDERKKYIRTTNVHITAKERRWLTLGIAMTILSAMIPLMFGLADVFCYQLMDKTFAFFRSNFTRVDPPNVYQMKIAGEGFMAQLLSNLLDLFAPFSLARRGDLWRGCFVEPSPPDYTYALRTRHLIALYYFPERARPRAVHLYNTVLNQRQNVLNDLMNRRTKVDVQPEVVEDNEFQKCARCSRGDLTIKNASNARVCIHCNVFYCVDCYTIRRLCISCGQSLQKLEENLDLYVDSSCSEEEVADKTGTTTQNV